MGLMWYFSLSFLQTLRNVCFGFVIMGFWQYIDEGQKLALGSSITKCEKSKEVWRLCQCTLLLLGITTYYCKFPLALNQICPVMLLDKHLFALFTLFKPPIRGFKLNQWGGVSEVKSAAGTVYSFNSCSLFSAGTKPQDRGEDRKKETLSVCEWGERAEHTLCSTLLPSNTCSLSVPILALDALLSQWIGFQAWHGALWDWGPGAEIKYANSCRQRVV